MARFFEKISFEQFKQDISDDLSLYQEYSLPKRATKKSAGYDGESVIDFVLAPGETKKVPLGIKACMNYDEVLLLLIRSSQGFRSKVRMCNQVGVIDSDYYNNPDNEEAQTEFNDAKKDLQIFELMVTKKKPTLELADVHRGDKICQMIFMNYLTVDHEEEITQERVNGFGSTDRKEG